MINVSCDERVEPFILLAYMLVGDTISSTVQIELSPADYDVITYIINTLKHPKLTTIVR